MTCQRCGQPRPIHNYKRRLCRGCNKNMTKKERRAHPPVQAPLEAPDLPRDNRRTSIAARTASRRAAWRAGYSQHQIARCWLLNAQTVARYVNEEVPDA